MVSDRRSDDQRDHDRDQRRDDHLALRGLGDDVDALAVLRCSVPSMMPGCSRKLAAHLFDDRLAGAADGRHRQGGEEADHHAADQQAMRTCGSSSRNWNGLAELGPAARS